jgi:MFS family permease
MGIGRFAFTPLFPLMVRDGLLDGEAGAFLAASNYLGYLVGALLASRLSLKAETLLALGLIGTVAVTAAVGWTASFPVWAILRFLAGVLSAWTVVATSTWGLGWLAATGRGHLAGLMFAGVGAGIAAAGLFCLALAGSSSQALWVDLALVAAVAVLLPLAASRRLPAPVPTAPGAAAQAAPGAAPARTSGLIACYSLFGFGYILPATYLPALARQLVDDPAVFGWAWPVFGTAAALSTVLVSWRLHKANRLKVWAGAHIVMAAGVLLPALWVSLAGVVVAALLVGGTFMVITMLGMQEARQRAHGKAAEVLGRMTAGFAFGQLMGPVVTGAIGQLTGHSPSSLHYALTITAAGLILSAVYLWREAGRPLSSISH